MIKITYTRHATKTKNGLVAYFPTAMAALKIIALWNRAGGETYTYEICNVEIVADDASQWHPDVRLHRHLWQQPLLSS